MSFRSAPQPGKLHPLDRLVRSELRSESEHIRERLICDQGGQGGDFQPSHEYDSIVGSLLGVHGRGPTTAGWQRLVDAELYV